MSLYAHTPRPGSDEWHDLKEHLQRVGEKTREAAAKFGAGDVGYVLGLSHDLAKADPRFQDYLRRCHANLPAKSEPHAAPSAMAVYRLLGSFVIPIVGHHMGLKDAADIRDHLTRDYGESVACAASLWAELESTPYELFKPPSDFSPIECEMLIRMLFSALVDSDYLDTEAHFLPSRTSQRGHGYEMGQLAKELRGHMAQFEGKQGKVNKIRSDVLEDCRKAAVRSERCGRGAYRLTVPTGGGKTLAALSFALDHASTNAMDRVIVAIPYTSIIDQTAQVYEGVFGPGVVLEHHSARDPDGHGSDLSQEGQSEAEIRRRLAAENWDAPIILTTTVQLFESLFAARSSRCRKLHNIARSVIVLDEVQTLPPPLLEPILDVLGQLVSRYGCTVVFCTATQPDFSTLQGKLSPKCFELLTQAIEIVVDPERHFETLRRVEYVLELEPRTPAQVARRVQSERQVLCVLNTRKDAVSILRACDDKADLFHLSTLMCPHHRKVVLTEVRSRLNEGRPVRLVSTQVVEAGVDVDFPLVMRDLGPLDRIVQVAGRCNREGKMDGLGTCIVFELEGGSAPRGSYRTGRDLTRTTLREVVEGLDQPSIIASYFRDLYGSTKTDMPGIQQKRELWNYETVSRDFKMIKDDTISLVVLNYEPRDCPEAVSDLLATYGQGSPRDWLRAMRQYTVSAAKYEVEKLERQGWIQPHESGLQIYTGPYDDLFGIGSGEERDPADLIA
ncbi:MAG: CRISPR-associated helicase Cas3' [Methanoregulaceae archaeon]|nr:CRISPR-associated helicase Cas3' [Methanoregulaceae archaeon]